MSTAPMVPEIDINLIDPNPANHGDRVQGDAEDAAMVASIHEHGILQPLVLRRKADGRYEIIAGERRWRNGKEAGLTKVPYVLRENLSETATGDILLTENIQRRNLSPYEQITALLDRVRRHRLDAQAAGKDKPSVEDVGKRIGMPGRQAQRLWTVAGRLDDGTRQAIQESTILRRSMSLADLERVGNTHIEERRDLLTKLAEMYAEVERPAQARRRAAPAIKRGRVVIKDGRRCLAQCSVVTDERLPSDRVDQPVVGLEVRVPAIADLADPTVRQAVVAQLRKTVEQLIAEVASGKAFTTDGDEGEAEGTVPVALVSTRSFEGLPGLGEPAGAVPLAGGDDEPEVAGRGGGMIEESDQVVEAEQGSGRSRPRRAPAAAARPAEEPSTRQTVGRRGRDGRPEGRP